MDNNEQEFAFQIFSWVFYAQRPLGMWELREALSVREGDTELGVEEEYPTSQTILECCRGLLHMWEPDDDDSKVGFIHQTVETFLGQTGRLDPINVAKVCLSYLSFDVFEDYHEGATHVIPREKRYAFNNYAARFWSVHVKGEAESSRDVQRAVFFFLASEMKRYSMVQMEKVNFFYHVSQPQGETLLHVLAARGLAILCSVALDRKSITGK
jgi:hypothetical protein